VEDATTKVMKIELDKRGLCALVRGTEPDWELFSHELIRGKGAVRGGHDEGWEWDWDFSSFSEENLYETYLLIRDYVPRRDRVEPRPVDKEVQEIYNILEEGKSRPHLGMIEAATAELQRRGLPLDFREYLKSLGEVIRHD